MVDTLNEREEEGSEGVGMHLDTEMNENLDRESGDDIMAPSDDHVSFSTHREGKQVVSELLRNLRRKANTNYLSPEKNVPMEISPMKVGCLQSIGTHGS